MTVPTSDSREDYAGNGATTAFDFAFKIFAASHLQVYLTSADGVETPLILNTDYSVAGVGDSEGGTVTYPLAGDPLPSGASITIIRVLPIVQETDLRNQGGFFPQVIEDELDKSRMIDQQQQEALDRALKKTEGGPDYDAGANRIENLGEPVAATDAATKGYTDTRFSRDVITLTADKWDGKGKRTTNFATATNPEASELVNAGHMQAYINDVLSGGGGVVPATFLYSGDNSTTVFSIAGATIADPSAYTVTIDGVDQRPGTDYSISVTNETLTFAEAPPAPFAGETNNIMIRVLGFQRALSELDTSKVTTYEGTVLLPDALNARATYVGSVAEDLAGRAVVEGRQISATAWPAGAYAFATPRTGGGGVFVGDTARAKSEHNGGTIVSPTVPKVSEQAGATYAEKRNNYLNGVGETDPSGTGCFVRTFSGPVDVMMFGALGDGLEVDDRAVQKAVDVSKSVFLPVGKFLFSQVVHYKSGQQIVGSGVVDKGYYSGAYLAFESGTVILLDGAITAFSAKGGESSNNNCIGAHISNMSFWVKNYDSGSAAGALPNALAGTTAIDMTGVSGGRFENIGLFNLENGFLSTSTTINAVQYTNRNEISSITAADVTNVVHCMAKTSNSAHADLTCSDFTNIIHVGYAFLLYDLDGFTLTDSTIFQCYYHSIRAENCPFVNISGSKLFENGSGNLLAKNVSYLDISGTTFARAGAYTSSTVPGVTLDNVKGGSIQGIVERPRGSGFNILGSEDVTIDCSIIEPGYFTGVAQPGIFVQNSKRMSLNGSIRRGPGNVAVNVSSGCTDVSGSLATDGYVVGAAQNIKVSGEVYAENMRVPEGTGVGASGSLQISKHRFIVPDGGKIYLTYLLYFFANALNIRVNNYIPSGNTRQEITSAELIYENTSGAAVVFDLPIYVHNPTAGALNTGNADLTTFKVKMVVPN